MRFYNLSQGNLTSLLNIVTAKQRPPLEAQKTRAIYKKRHTNAQGGKL
jgi:hypothetical protein